MYYRRKVLLSLLEAFSGELAESDCHLLLLLFCLRSKSDCYDFFPHTQGPFSLVLQQDKGRLTDLGFLIRHQHFQLNKCPSYQDQLRVKDRIAIQSLVSEVGDMRGEELLRKISLEAPQIGSRSRITPQLLTSEEQGAKHVQQENPCLFTIGYEGLSIDAYLDILIANHVASLVDVRKNPFSMKYGFSRAQLVNATKLAGIAYIHLPDLGVPSSLRKDLNCEEAYQSLFEYYISQILPAHTGAIEQLKLILRKFKRVALTCFEAEHTSCHRHKLVEYLEADPRFSLPVVHLTKDSPRSIDLGLTQSEAHSQTAFQWALG